MRCVQNWVRSVESHFGESVARWGVFKIGWGVFKIGWGVFKIEWGVFKIGWGVFKIGWGVLKSGEEWWEEVKCGLGGNCLCNQCTWTTLDFTQSKFLPLPYYMGGPHLGSDSPNSGTMPTMWGGPHLGLSAGSTLLHHTPWECTALGSMKLQPHKSVVPLESFPQDEIHTLTSL